MQTFQRQRLLIVLILSFGFFVTQKAWPFEKNADVPLNWSGVSYEREARPVQNVIVLIPDGTSLATYSAARWYQSMMNPEKNQLAIDPFVTGLVRTYSSNAPIGDSAPTTSCYMTGMPSQSGFVSTYPKSAGPNDLIAVDPVRAYQPLMTLLEATRLLQGRATGLVFTCEFPHATPADCSAHSYARSDYMSIVSQMVHNQLDVVIGGGVDLLTEAQLEVLKSRGYDVLLNEATSFRTYEGDRLWSLFQPRAMSYDLDRDASKEPSLAEMTSKAIDVLSKNESGFFLMVEGSKVDWAAHANDVVGMLTEYLAFDQACQVAFDYAKKQGNTAVIVLSDHGNSGLSIGATRCPGYDKLSKEQLFGSIRSVNRTVEGIATSLNANAYDLAAQIIQSHTGFEFTSQELHGLTQCKDYKQSPIAAQDRRSGPSLTYYLAACINERTCFGFTTHGHTGEDVLLAAWHPLGDVPVGVLHNYEINAYLAKLLQVEGQLPMLSDRYFAAHTAVFSEQTFELRIDDAVEHPVLHIRKGRNRMEVVDDSNIIRYNGKTYELPTVAVYVKKNETFYLPTSLTGWFK